MNPKPRSLGYTSVPHRADHDRVRGGSSDAAPLAATHAATTSVNAAVLVYLGRDPNR